jgi:hypothetical protein
MAYKDEYEVARLYTDGRFAAELAGTFKGGKTKVWLSPPLLAPKGPDGKPKKIAFGGWMLDVAFPMMAKMKGLRGGALDIFGHTEERKMERGLMPTTRSPSTAWPPASRPRACPWLSRSLRSRNRSAATATSRTPRS